MSLILSCVCQASKIRLSQHHATLSSSVPLNITAIKCYVTTIVLLARCRVTLVNYCWNNGSLDSRICQSFYNQYEFYTDLI